MQAFFLLISSCNNEGESSPVVKEDSIVNPVITEIDSLSSGCYSQIVQKDTSFLQIENKDSIIDASLSYNIYQKDRNDGTVQGEISGDILQGWYLFRSEGIVSVRQVTWKIKDNELWSGVGEMVQKNDTMLFAQPDKLQYDSVHPFKKVACIL